MPFRAGKTAPKPRRLRITAAAMAAALMLIIAAGATNISLPQHVPAIASTTAPAPLPLTSPASRAGDSSVIHAAPSGSTAILANSQTVEAGAKPAGASEAPGSFVTATVESSVPDDGQFSDIAAVDGNTQFVSYFDTDLIDLRFAVTNDGGATWATSVVDANIGGMNSSTSIAAVNAGTVLIGYEDYATGELRFARTSNGGTSWTLVTVDTTTAGAKFVSIAAVDTNTIFMSYLDNTNSDLKFAKTTTGGGSAGDWSSITVDSTDTVGYFTSIAAVDSNTIFISYQDVTNTDLKFAKTTTGGDSTPEWSTSTVDSADAGQFNSIVATGLSTVYISYLQNTLNPQLKFARSANGGTSWDLVVVDSSGTVGYYSSIDALDASTVFISYYDGSSADLRVATTTTGGGTSADWSTQALDGTGTSVGAYTSVSAFDPSNIFISYYDLTSENLKFAAHRPRWYPGNFSVDSDGDGLTNDVSFVLIDLDGDGDVDRIELSSDDSIFGETDEFIELSLNDTTISLTGTDNDEMFDAGTGISTSSEVTLGTYLFTVTFTHALTVSQASASVTSKTWLTSSPTIDTDGDGADDDPVNFVLSDQDSDGVPDTVDVSIGSDQVYGQTSGGTVNDGIVNFGAAGNSNDERFSRTAAEGTRTVRLGTHFFLVDTDADPLIDASDVRLTSRWYTGTIQADLDGDSVIETLDFVLLDPDSRGLYTGMELDSDGSGVYGASEVHTSNDFVTTIGDRSTRITFDVNPSVANPVSLREVSSAPAPRLVADEKPTTDTELLYDTSTEEERRELGLVAVPPAPRPPDPGSFIRTPDGQLLVSGEVVVVLRQDVPEPDIAIKRLARANSAEIVGSITSTRTYQLQVSASSDDDLSAVIKRIEAFKGIDGAAHHYLIESLGSRVPNDPYYNRLEVDRQINSSWDLEYIGAPAAWEVSVGSRTVPVAVVDAHFDPEHSDLASNVAKLAGSLTPAGGHGTHVAGTICAAGNNGTGFTGVAWECSLRLYDFGATSPVLAQDMMVKAVDDGARVVNMSLQWVDNNLCGKVGTSATAKKALEINSTLAPAIKYANRNRKDVLWVFAAGNECRDAVYAAPASLVAQFPANVITVASIDPDGRLSGFSNRGNLVSVAAPGGQILSTKPRDCTKGCIDTYAFDSGTSMAAPHVSGVAVLMLAANPGITAEKLKSCVTRSAKVTVPLQPFRVVDAEAAVRCVAIQSEPASQAAPAQTASPAQAATQSTPASPASPPAPRQSSVPPVRPLGDGDICGSPANPC